MKESSAVLVIVGLALASGFYATGQEWNYTWKIGRSGDAGAVQFTIAKSKWRHRSVHSSPVPLDRFRGLSREAMEHSRSLEFEYVHDAGRLLCEGSFSGGNGSGTYTFAPNPAFVSALRDLGYDPPNDDQLFTMVLTDVSLGFAREVRDAGLRASTSQLIELRVHGVDTKYISEVRDAGYTDFLAGDYVQMRIHGVRTDFLRDLKARNFNLTSRDIVELRIHGVDSRWMADLKDAGYNPPVREIVQLKIHGVGSDYLRALKSYGLQPDPSDLVEMKIHGISADYLKGLKDAGYGELRLEEIKQMKMHGVRPEFLQEARDLGYNFTAREATEMRIHGVDGSYLRKLHDSGMRNLTADKIVKLRIHGIE